ncbi:hypothetical protein Ancab_012539 [Ancistrocladus abbreviatus]
MRRPCACLLVLLAMQMMAWISATSRQLARNHDPLVQNQGNGSSPDSYKVQFSSKQDSKGIEEKQMATEGYKEVKKIGSRPPNCENKCYGCTPCEAIQVPTITGHLSLQYTNYLPEGWKCKCGPSFYSP